MLQVVNTNWKPNAWEVEWLHYGEYKSFITLDKNRADQFAVQHSGIIHPLYRPQPMPEMKNDTGTSTAIADVGGPFNKDC